MDLQKIDDIKELKSMAYDQVLAIETAQTNLRMIQTRMAELESKVE